MRTILISCGVLLLAGVAALVWNWTRGEHLGAEFDSAPQVALSELAAHPEGHLAQPLKVEGVIERQCPITGCWFYLKDSEGKQLRVDVADTIGNLPQRKGKKATVEGRLSKNGDEYELQATGVEFH